MADPLPVHAAKLPALHQSRAFNQGPFSAGSYLESQDHDGVSPRHSIASAERNPPSMDLKSRQEHSPDHHGIYWPIPVKMLVSFALGGIAAGAHSAWYHYLNAKIVQSPRHQENNIRFGSFLASATQLALGFSVWVAYRQWVWRGLKFEGLPLHALDAAFSAETSLLSLFKIDFARKLKIAWTLAVIAWSMQIPSIFTPATLTVVPSTETIKRDVQVPSLDMAKVPSSVVYSAPNQKNYTRDTDIATESLSFLGPRSVVQRLAELTASGGVIPPITPPSNHSSYSQSFSGPYVKCGQANLTVAAIIDNLLGKKMGILHDSYQETINAYYSFVPSLDPGANGTSTIADNGVKVTALAEPRLQRPQNATNELWLAFMRYKLAGDRGILTDINGTKVFERQFFQCKLHHAVYDIFLRFENDSQTVTKTNITLLESVDFPGNGPTNLTQHSYSAYFSVLTDQLVGSMGFYEDIQPNDVRSPAFGQINTAIGRNSLVGSNDLDFYFDINRQLYLNNTNKKFSRQRVLDKSLAKNQTLPYLIEDLSFNITISFLTNPLLSLNQTAHSEQISRVNRYAFNASILWLAYGLAIFFSLLAVAWGMIGFHRNKASHDMSVSTIMSITREPELDHLFPSCTHGKQPLPRETLRTKLKIMERAKDAGGGESLRPPDGRLPSSCPRCLRSRSVIPMTEEKGFDPALRLPKLFGFEL